MDTSPTPAELRFHQYRLLPAQRLLLDGARPVKLGSRAFDMLLVLIERRDRVVGKHELMDLVWPKLVVEENNLQVQVMALRKLLGHGAIATVPGRGYRFTLPVETDEPAPVPAPPAGLAGAEGLPTLVGRDEELRTLLGLIDEHPVVTVAGAGGIGKTRLAQSAAHACAPRRGGGVWWIELAGLSDPALVPIAVGQALGLQLDSQADPNGAVARALQGKAALLVLDNAEHLLDAVAALVATLRERAASVKLLVTSQEVMRGLDEQVFRPGPLALPQGDDLAAVRASGAVALFVARAQQADPRFTLHEHNSAAAADICRRLDGIPLAIELAAARVPLLGVEGVRTRLHDRFSLLTAGARAVMRRHQTLRAALEWSHGLLTAQEQVVFRRLGVFAGGFTLEAAQAVAADELIDDWDVLEHLGALVDKSLVAAEGDPAPRYRLLETTRLYALERLADAGDTERALRLHAAHILVMAQAFDAEAVAQGQAAALLDALDRERDNLLQALAWCERSEAGATGLALVAALRSYWPSRGLVPIGLQRCLTALARTEQQGVDATRSAALLSAGEMHIWLGQHGLARTLALAHKAQAERAADTRTACLAACQAGMAACLMGELGEAAALLGAARASPWAGDDLRVRCTVLTGLAALAAARSSPEQVTLMEEVLTLRRQMGQSYSIGTALLHLATAYIGMGRTEDSRPLLAELASLLPRIGSRYLGQQFIDAITAEAARQGDWVGNATLISASRTLRQASAMPLHLPWQRRQDREMDAARAALGRPGFDDACAAGRTLGFEAALSLAAQCVER